MPRCLIFKGLSGITPVSTSVLVGNGNDSISISVHSRLLPILSTRRAAVAGSGRIGYQPPIPQAPALTSHIGSEKLLGHVKMVGHTRSSDPFSLYSIIGYHSWISPMIDYMIRASNSVGHQGLHVGSSSHTRLLLSPRNTRPHPLRLVHPFLDRLMKDYY